VFVGVHRTWGEDRLFFLEADGVQRLLPTEWTDAAEPDVFVAMVGRRCPSREVAATERGGLRLSS